MCPFANEIQRIAIVRINSTHATAINETVRLNVCSLIGCLSLLLLNISLIIVEDLRS